MSPEVGLGVDVALPGGQAVPPDGFCVVLLYAPTFGVHVPEVGLGVGVALLGGQAVPPDGFCVVLLYAPTFNVHGPEVGLGVGVALLGRNCEQEKEFRFGAVQIPGWRYSPRFLPATNRCPGPRPKETIRRAGVKAFVAQRLLNQPPHRPVESDVLLDHGRILSGRGRAGA